MSLYRVELSKIEHILKFKLPIFIIDKIYLWALSVEMEGLLNIRKIASYHDEPLRGKRLGQRSIRLNRKYRLFYREIKGEIIVVEVIEVNAHEY